MRKFCSKGIFKLDVTGSGVIGMEDAPQFIQEPEPRGCPGKQQSAQQAWQHWQEIIYLSFIPSVLSSLLLPHFINFHSCSLICFPLTGDLVQGEIPNPSHEQQEQQDLCLRSVVQTNTSLGITDSCPCSIQRKSSSVSTVLPDLFFHLCTRSLRIRLYWQEFQHKFRAKWKHSHLEGRFGQEMGTKQEVKAMGINFKNFFIGFGTSNQFPNVL